jgi:D-alanyl-D-alanine carboxypeptidase
MKDVAAVWTSAYEFDKKRSESIWAKTGTIDGVSGVAGIAPGLSDMIYVFAIVVEGNIPKEEAIKIEDSLVGLIAGVGK